MALLGGIRLADNFSATKMPQGAASAWAALDGLEFTGAGYKPLLYIGNQLVNGTNYWFIAEQTIYRKSAVKALCFSCGDETAKKQLAKTILFFYNFVVSYSK